MPSRKTPITTKQRAFIQEYLVDLNATAAAARAGYSKKSARSTSAVLLTKPVIIEALGKAMEARAKRTEIDADWVLVRLRDELQADLLDIYDEGGNLRPVADWPLIWRQGLVSGVDVKSIVSKKKTIGRVSKVKLSDRAKRLELVGRHVNVMAFAERTEVGGIGGKPIEVADVGITEVARRIAFILAKASKDQESST